MGFLSKLWNNMKGDDFNWQNVIETNKDKIEKEAERGYNFDFDQYDFRKDQINTYNRMQNEDGDRKKERKGRKPEQVNKHLQGQYDFTIEF